MDATLCSLQGCCFFLINLSRVAANGKNQSSIKDSASRDLGREKQMGDFWQSNVALHLILCKSYIALCAFKSITFFTLQILNTKFPVTIHIQINSSFRLWSEGGKIGTEIQIWFTAAQEWCWQV